MKRLAWWLTEHAVRKGLTFRRGGQWWSVGAPRKPQRCAECGGALPAGDCHVMRREGRPVWICQPCGRQGRETVAEALAALEGTRS